MDVLHDIFGTCLFVLLAYSSYQMPCDYYLCENLTKSTYMNSVCTQGNLKKIIRLEVWAISRKEHEKGIAKESRNTLNINFRMC